MYQEQVIETADGTLCYSKSGTGNRALLCFHGFGQTKEIFQPWVERLCADYTIYSFDLFYHGKSHRPFEKLSKNRWSSYLEQFLEQEELSRFDVLGYSLGGRFAIATAFCFREKVQHLTLIAPDGIYLTPWFKLATYPVLKTLLKWAMLHPSLIDRLLNLNDRFPIIDSYIAQFIRKELGSLENRKRVYVSWNYFKSLGYNKRQLAEGFTNSKYSKTLVLGDKDHVLPPKVLLPLIKKMGAFRIHRLPMKHHQLIRPEVAIFIGK